MPLFTETIITAGLLSLFMSFLILIDKKDKRDDIIFFLRAWPAGILLVLGVTVANSITANRWTYDYILEFLSLKDVGIWTFRILAGLGYIFIVVSSISLIAFRLKSFIKKGKQNEI